MIAGKLLEYNDHQVLRVSDNISYSDHRDRVLIDKMAVLWGPTVVLSPYCIL